MAFRGRGRGRFGGGGFGYAKQEPFVLFPDIELPPKKDISADVNRLVIWNWKFHTYIRDLPYFLDENEKKEESIDIERYSDKVKKRSISTRQSISNCGYIILEPGNFPLELIRGTKRRSGRKVQWNPKQDLKKLDMLEQLEEKFKDEDPGNKKKGGDDDVEEEEQEEQDPEDLEDDDSDDDYGQNIDFDDDEDDYNQLDSGGDEDIL